MYATLFCALLGIVSLNYHFIICINFLAVLPHIIPFGIDEEINNGDSIQLNCHVSKGDVPLKIIWYFKSQLLQNPSVTGITTTKIGGRTSLLTISPAQATNSGTYTCSASNSAGTVNFTTTVYVNGIFLPFHYMF